MSENLVRVGVGVYIRHQGKILFMFRKKSHAKGTWHPPGGHVDFGESLEESVKRETLEEVGVKIENIRQIAVTEDIFEEYKKHYVTLHYVADLIEGEVAKVMEPEKCEKIEWFSWENRPEPLAKFNENFVKLGINPMDF